MAMRGGGWGRIFGPFYLGEGRGDVARDDGAEVFGVGHVDFFR